MPFNQVAAKRRLQAFDFTGLFIEELGWDRFPGAAIPLEINDHSYALERVAEKRGVGVFLCREMPDNATRRKIERQITKQLREHLIIYADPEQTIQKWQWVRRETGKPLACREHEFRKGQSGEAMAQRLDSLYVAFEEEERVSTTDVTRRTRRAFDVEKVTKAFYKNFQEEHKVFLGFIEGITAQGDKDWYASVMLNRLMFCYFIQKKGYLDGDTDYLRNRMQTVRKQHGGDKFYSFYRYFLLRLFHEGLGDDQHDADLEALIGKVPYLNGGLFAQHPIEERNDTIDIDDAAFERVFDFFDGYSWHLDDRPLRSDSEINPDVLGYIFEKYINQKQMGAYYTKEDITEYISRSTIIPFLFDAAKKACPIAFQPESYLWRLLAEDPDRYVFEAVKHGAAHELPENIAAGLDDVAGRGDWNTSAPPEYALPTEIWREVVARRKRYQEVRGKLAQGEVSSINEFITLNLDIRQFAEDAIAGCEGPELLRAFWKAINRVTVLDPTCGSGAFLFAALNILEPLYETCLERMAGFLEDLERSTEKHRPEKFSDFKKVLAEMEKHPNRRYFIYKSIILNNLYGVDIMEEATEIAKLRLFLKLASLTDRDESRPNMGLEPLPDIDFNIRSGNTLVGFARLKDVRKSMRHTTQGQGRFMFGEDEDALRAIEEEAENAQHLLKDFREQQTVYGGKVTIEDKLQLRRQLSSLEEKLNHQLSREYGLTPEDLTGQSAYQGWKDRYQPLHWFIDFPDIMNDGGFDVIIGNPPYLEFREVNYDVKGYTTRDSAAVHAVCIERSERLMRKNSCVSMIVPLALVSTQRMKPVQTILENGRSIWYANFAWRPAKLFDTVNRALTIFVVTPTKAASVYTTAYMKWTSDTRDMLMPCIAYTEAPETRPAFWVPKLSNETDRGLLEKLLGIHTHSGRFMLKHGENIFYRCDGGLYWKVFTDFAPKFRLNGIDGQSSRETRFSVSSKHVKHMIALLSSNTFWWWYTLTSNLRHLNPYDVQHFPIPESAFSDSSLAALGSKYIEDIDRNSTMLVREQKKTGRTETQSFKIQKSKPIIDEIDRVLARHYGFTDEELDFIINYDIKYRMGLSSSNNG